MRRKTARQLQQMLVDAELQIDYAQASLDNDVNDAASAYAAVALALIALHAEHRAMAQPFVTVR